MPPSRKHERKTFLSSSFVSGFHPTIANGPSPPRFLVPPRSSARFSSVRGQRKSTSLSTGPTRIFSSPNTASARSTRHRSKRFYARSRWTPSFLAAWRRTSLFSRQHAKRMIATIAWWCSRISVAPETKKTTLTRSVFSPRSRRSPRALMFPS